MSNDSEHRLLFVPPSIQDHRQGVLSAAIVLVMYGDYQCSRSADVYRLIKVLKRQLNASFKEDDVCFIFRHFPQSQLHPYAQRAAEAAVAAAVQGQFWQMHDALFIHQQELGDGYLVEYANNLGLNICQFLQDMYKHIYLGRIHQDIESGTQSGVTVAPVLFINGVRYCDRWNLKQLMATIVAATD